MIKLFQETVGPPIMARTVSRLAELRPELCDGSGLGFWPIPAAFPLVLSTAIERAQLLITELYLTDKSALATQLARSRSAIVLLSDEGGDLGEDHCALYLNDHPGLLNAAKDRNDLPFRRFCTSALEINDPLELIGFIARNEEGSLGEIHALMDAGLIAKGVYFDVHAQNEAQHEEISRRSLSELSKQDVWRNALVEGARKHDALYLRAIH